MSDSSESDFDEKLTPEMMLAYDLTLALLISRYMYFPPGFDFSYKIAMFGGSSMKQLLDEAQEEAMTKQIGQSNEKEVNIFLNTHDDFLDVGLHYDSDEGWELGD